MLVSCFAAVQSCSFLSLQVQTERTEAITDAWYHPIDASVFSVPDEHPQVVVHSYGVRAMCLTQDGCHVSRSINDTPILTYVAVDGKMAVITGSGFGTDPGEGEFLLPVEIGSIECMRGANGTWTDTEIQCELESPLLPGYSVVKVLRSTAAAANPLCLYVGAVQHVQCIIAFDNMASKHQVTVTQHA